MWVVKKFYFGDNISVGVRDVDRAIAWYQEKLGLRLTPLKSEDFSAFLAFAKDGEIGLALSLERSSEQITKRKSFLLRRLGQA
jgi:catechol 2,3-dioxygenase-like lactoylglutathione lyase family enzyme